MVSRAAKLPLYQIDAFAGAAFAGNPAAVCPLEAWLEDATLQAIAGENNLSETAFIVGGDGAYELRWFTPVAEVALCGHATLASAFVIFTQLDPGRARVTFATRESGSLTVERVGEHLAMDFPAVPAEPIDAPEMLSRALGRAPDEVLATERDYLTVFSDEDEIRALAPDGAALLPLDRPGLIVTAPGREADFVLRLFAPPLGVPEDPVTGSAHSTLVPYWALRLGKDEFHAVQLSARGGELHCRARGERVTIAGTCVLYLTGDIHI